MAAVSARPAHWRIAIGLGCAGAVAVLLLMPYLFALMPELPSRIRLSLPLFALAQTTQGGIVIGLCAWLGLRLGYPLGLDAPVLRHYLYATPTPRARWLFAASLGAAVGLTCLLGLLAHPTHDTTDPNWWQGLLASFYGGIVEETLCRLFLVSLLVWATARILRTPVPGPQTYWHAVVAAALLFGALHLPTLAQVGAFDSFNIARVIVLNALCGIVFGWLFWRYGLEHAMLAHFSADLVLHVAAPLLA